MFSKFFINRPIFATVLALLIVVAGLVTLNILPVAQFPEITPPTVQVSAVYPGANAETVAQTVGIPIEQQVNGVDGMLYMSSNSSSSGAYSLTITFAVGTDIDMATVQVQNRVSVAQSSLPEPVVVQGVTVQKQSSNIVMFLTMTSQDSVYNSLYLTNYAKLNLVDQLTRVPGVGAVNVMGAGDYSMRIWLDPEAMRIRNISPQQVYQSIQSQNMEVSAGYIGQPIGEENKNAFQYTLNVQGRLSSPEQFGNIIIHREQDGAMLRLKDIARIDLGSASYSVVSRLKGQPTAAIAIYQQPGSNSLDVSKGVKAKMQELAANFPAGVSYNVTLDTTDVIHASIDEVMVTFFETTLLVILVIFLFLQNWRAVIIPCLTIPVSLIGTLAVMAAFGFSINTLTLFGLILAVAIVVDDAIVVVENASRLLETGQYSTREAVTKAMGEITGPIVGVVLVLLAVFIPTMLISGISGQLYKQFALTIAASTVLSGFNSLTLTPALCALFLEKSKPSNFFIYKGFNKVTPPGNSFDVYDLAALAYIYKRIKETDPVREASHVVIDEAQDFGMMAYRCMDACLSGCTYTIMGDTSQNIHFQYGLNDWDELRRLILTGDYDAFGLLRKSYRNTVEISTYANEILRHGDFSIYPVEPIIRHGAGVCVEPVQGERALLNRAAETIQGWQRKGYETIAVICRDEEEAELVAARLAEDVPVKNGAKGETEEFGDGVMVLPVSYTKGLEFDAVLLFDPSEKKYPSDNGHVKLLYVAATRALHELTILHRGELSGILAGRAPQDKHIKEFAAEPLTKAREYEKPVRTKKEQMQQRRVEGAMDMAEREYFGPRRIAAKAPVAEEKPVIRPAASRAVRPQTETVRGQQAKTVHRPQTGAMHRPQAETVRGQQDMATSPAPAGKRPGPEGY